MTQQASPLSTLISRHQLLTSPKVTQLNYFFTTLNEGMFTLRGTVISEDWDAVLHQALHCLGVGYSIFRFLQSETALIDQSTSTFAEINRSLADIFRAIARSDHRAQMSSQFRDLVATNKPGKLPELEQSLQMLGEGNTDNVPLLNNLANTPSAPGSSFVNSVCKTTIAALCQGLLAQVHANFNLAYHAIKNRPYIRQVLDPYESLANEIDAFRTVVRSYQLQLYQSMAATGTSDEISQLACGLAGFIERTLPAFSRAQATAHVVASALYSQGKGNAAERLGALAVEAGTITREGIASHVSAYKIASEVLRSTPDEKVAFLMKEANNIPFETEFPNGRNLEISKLGEIEDGTYVEVKGFAAELKARRSADEKLIGHIRLLDPSSQNTADAVVIYTDFRHIGITRGTYCRVNGTFRQASRLNDGQPTIEVEKLSSGKLAKKSWRLAFLRCADPWFEPWRNHLNLYWALGPHEIAGVDPQSSNGGAGELIYPPFVRK